MVCSGEKISIPQNHIQTRGYQKGWIIQLHMYGEYGTYSALIEGLTKGQPANQNSAE